jgi:hypothetical protein
MAYNSFFPATYQPMGYYGQPNPYYQQAMAQQAQGQAQSQQAQGQPPAIQQSGFVPVRSEQEARSYPVAPGNSITFKDETAPFCYVKTMGFNQLDSPTFEKYRLVKEDAPEEVKPREEKSEEYATKKELAALWEEINALKAKEARDDE